LAFSSPISLRIIDWMAWSAERLVEQSQTNSIFQELDNRERTQWSDYRKSWPPLGLAVAVRAKRSFWKVEWKSTDRP
jgi:hypothetical protein